jgi:hypothetical protein
MDPIKSVTPGDWIPSIPESETIVSMCEYKEELYIATGKNIYLFDGINLKRIDFYQETVVSEPADPK